MTTTQISQANWMNPTNAPKKVVDWAGHQMVQVVKSNEVFDRWLRFDGETLVVRR